MRTEAQKAARRRYEASEKGKAARKRHETNYVLSGGRAVVEQARRLKPISPARKAARVRWAKRNKAYFAADRALRRHLARFPLHPAFQAEIDAMYMFCMVFPDYQVDHIIPVKGKEVCGLHVPWNMQVIESTANKRKGNKLYKEYLNG